MFQGVDAVVTHSIYSALHSVGGIEILFPLFNQLDHKQMDGSLDTSVWLELFNFFFVSLLTLIPLHSSNSFFCNYVRLFDR